MASGVVSSMDGREKLAGMRAAERLAARDATLFVDAEIAATRLGFIGLPAHAAGQSAALATLGDDVRASGITDIVLLGMGGSSLAPLVVSRVIGNAVGSPILHVVDTTSPVQVATLLARLWPASTLVVVSSKSGTTVEPLSLAAIFRAWMDPLLGEQAGLHFVAITDPGSPLESYASEHGFAAVFHAPTDVGGRYAALTPFCTVPSAMIGVDVAMLAERAVATEKACSIEAEGNPATSLAAWLADSYSTGHDKLTLVCSDEYAPFGLWVEQLVAESTGKRGRGLLPVLEPSPGDPAAHGTDRMVCVLRHKDDEQLAALGSWLPTDTPCFEILVSDPYDLGSEFVRWEWAVALFSVLADIEPFDQPNVEEAKVATRDILEGRRHGPAIDLHMGGIDITTSLPTLAPSEASSLAAALGALLHETSPGSYLAVLAYLPEDERLLGQLRGACAEVAAARRMAVTLELGPRYLHSTGQYHKGGPARGRFLIVTAKDAVGPSVPGQRYTLAELHRAQAEGDHVTLASRGLPVVRVDLPSADPGPIRVLAETLRGAALS
jgi:transaldolase / glucose-6-phosphate isomerase